jgi:hypothetical protein
MTEEEWLTARSAEPMLSAPSVAFTPRHLRLFAVGCARQLLDEHPAPAVAREALEYAEDAAEELRSAGELRDRLRDYEAKMRVWTVSGASRSVAITNQILAPNALTAALAACRTLVLARGGRYRPWVTALQHRQLGSVIPGEELPRVLGEAGELCADLFRDVVGNPFRPVAFDAAWRSDTAVSIAKGMYESHDFSPMPILADALQDAGCNNDDVLNHCRDANATHVRGCWVVDSVMGKE